MFSSNKLIVAGRNCSQTRQELTEFCSKFVVFNKFASVSAIQYWDRDSIDVVVSTLKCTS